MTLAYSPERPARTFDLSMVGRDYIAGSASKRAAIKVVAVAIAGLGVVFAVSLFLFGTLAPGLTLARQFLAFVVGGLVIYVAIRTARTAFRDPSAEVARELTIDQAGRCSFRFDQGSPFLADLASPSQTLRIIDYRPTATGLSDGAPALVDPTRRRLPITGLACDAILETARGLGILVTASSLPTASFSGRPLGKAVVWTLNPGTGVVGWWRRNS